MKSYKMNESIRKNEYMHNLLQFIEDNMPIDINIPLLSNIGYASCSRLYRDFYNLTGHSVKEYVRKRRISNACEKIKCSDMPLAIITDESGYKTQQAFHKQFKSIVGMTPLEYRRSDTYFYFHPFTVKEISLAVKVGMETIPECTVARFYDSCLIGIEDKAIAALGEITGRVFGRNGKQMGNQLCYEVMTEQSGAGKTDLYATCIVDYNEPEINYGWNYLYNTWLSASMFEESGAYFEEYIFHNGKPRKLKLYLPVKKRKTEQHITIKTTPESAFVIARARGPGAERKASEKVMAFLQEYYPLTIRNAQRFLVCVYNDIYECGMECGGGSKLPCGSGLEIKHIPTGRYAVLLDDRLGDMSMGAAKMDLWLRNNSIAHENEPVFAVYETSGGRYDNENIRMELYKRLKI